MFGVISFGYRTVLFITPPPPPPPPPVVLELTVIFLINVIRERCSKCVGFVCFVLGPVTVEINDQLTEIMACDAKVS